MGAVPAGRPGHVSGNAEAALHEGAGAHRQILRGVPPGAAVRGGRPLTATALVQQELCGQHVTTSEFILENPSVPSLDPKHGREEGRPHTPQTEELFGQQSESSSFKVWVVLRPKPQRFAVPARLTRQSSEARLPLMDAALRWRSLEKPVFLNHKLLERLNLTKYVQFSIFFLDF